MKFFCQFILSGGAARSNGARSNSTGNARTPGIVGSGGLGLPEMEGIFGTLDSSALNLFMENPAVTQVRQSLLSNPQYLDQVELPTVLNQRLNACSTSTIISLTHLNCRSRG